MFCEKCNNTIEHDDTCRDPRCPNGIRNLGVKHDQGKLLYDLVPVQCLKELVTVLTYGAKKYSPNNWQKVEPFNDRYYAALMRHLELWRSGEWLDAESNLPHLAHVMCNAMFLLWKESV